MASIQIEPKARENDWRRAPAKRLADLAQRRAAGHAQPRAAGQPQLHAGGHTGLSSPGRPGPGATSRPQRRCSRCSANRSSNFYATVKVFFEGLDTNLSIDDRAIAAARVYRALTDTDKDVDDEAGEQGQASERQDEGDEACILVPSA